MQVLLGLWGIRPHSAHGPLSEQTSHSLVDLVLRGDVVTTYAGPCGSALAGLLGQGSHSEEPISAPSSEPWERQRTQGQGQGSREQEWQRQGSRQRRNQASSGPIASSSSAGSSTHAQSLCPRVCARGNRGEKAPRGFDATLCGRWHSARCFANTAAILQDHVQSSRGQGLASTGEGADRGQARTPSLGRRAVGLRQCRTWFSFRSSFFAKQAQERDAYLSQIATATTQWAQRAKSASAALATITAEGDPAAQDTEEDQAAADAAAQAAEDRRQRCAVHTRAMLEAF